MVAVSSPVASGAPPNRLAIALACVTFGMLGVCLILPGALLPLLVDRFSMRLIEAGSMLALQPIGYLLAVLSASRLIERFGMRAVLRGGLITAAAGFAGFGLVSAWTSGAAMMFVTGLGIGVVEVTGNALVITVGGERRASVLNFVHLFFGVGSVVTPVLVTHAVAAGVSWTSAFVVTGCAAALVGIAWNVLPHGTGDGTNAAADRAPLHGRLVFLLAVMLGLYVGTEMGIGSWLTKYMVSVRTASLTTAGNALSLYWLGLTAGRLVLSVLSHRVREERLIIALACGATAALVAAIVASSPSAAVVGFAATGLGFSGIFPAVIALGGRYHPRSTARATSVLIGGASVGGIVIPWSMSGIADGIGLVAGMSFYAAMSAMMIVLAVLVARSLPTPR